MANITDDHALMGKNKLLIDAVQVIAVADDPILGPSKEVTALLPRSRI